MTATAPDPAALFALHQCWAERKARLWRRRLALHGDPWEAISPVLEGLREACASYDPARGLPFRAYAALRMRGSLTDWLRRQDHLPRLLREKVKRGEVREPRRVPIRTSRDLAEDDGFAESGVYGAPEPADPQAAKDFRRRELADLIDRALLFLPPRSAQMVRWYWFGGLTQKRIAGLVGVCESRAAQILAQALRELRERLGRQWPELAGKEQSWQGQ